MGWILVGYALYVLLLVITAPIWLTTKFWPVVSVVFPYLLALLIFLPALGWTLAL